MTDVLDGSRRRLRQTFTGQSDGVPEWVRSLADGDHAGHFPPGSAAWTVHGSMATTVAGIRALLLQTLHPGAMAGVHDFSRFRDDPLGRLAGTIRWIFTVTYGDTATAARASDWVRSIHDGVTGTYLDSAGQQQRYAANDPELLSWVHLAFTDSFLQTHQVWGGAIPGGADQYVREWATAAELMRVPHPPRSEQQLRAQLAGFDDAGILTRSDRVDEVIRFIRDPPLHPSLRAGYKVLFAGAIATLEPHHRQLLGLKRAAVGPFPVPSVTATRAVLHFLRLALGRTGPSELAARRRLASLSIPGSAQ